MTCPISHQPVYEFVQSLLFSAGMPATVASPIDAGLNRAATPGAALQSARKYFPHGYFGNHFAKGNHRTRVFGALESGHDNVSVVMPSITLSQ